MVPAPNSNTNTDVALTRIDKLKLALSADSVQQQFKNAMGENSGAFVASIIDLYISDTYLQNCDPNQVIGQCLKAAVMKLPINKALGFAFIVPYKKGDQQIPQFQIGWKGFVQLAIRTNMYKHINCEEVYDGEYILKNKLTGEFDLNGVKKNETVIGFFAHFELLNGFSKTLFMTVAAVQAHASKYSKSYTQAYGPWKLEFEAMAKKTVLKLLLSKFGYLSIDMAQAMDGDDTMDQVQSEIQLNGNKQNFDAAQVVNTQPLQTQQPAAAAAPPITPAAEQTGQQNNNNDQQQPERVPF
jgi:recombination protein RecT